MKNILSLIFLFSIIFCHAADKNYFSTENYFFTDDENIISPEIDYSSIFIVFNDDISTETLFAFEQNNNMLSYDDNYVITWQNKRVYTLHKSVRNEPESAELFLSILRNDPNILSAYPTFIHNGEEARIDNLFLLNIKKENADPSFIRKLIEPYEGLITEELDLINSITYVIMVPASVNLFTICNTLYEDSRVEYAQPNFYFGGNLGFIPNDPLFSDQWFLNQDNDADIDAIEAWNLTTGSSSIAVAVIDGHGFDLDHMEMSGKYISPYNAVDDNNNPLAIDEEENHATACAGLIGALTNNATGIASVGYNIKVIPIKMGFDFSAGSFYTSELVLIRACEHVMTSPYEIVAVSNSYSLGSWADIASIRNAFSYMRTDSRGGLGTVVLASTGNDNAANVISYPSYFANVVGVGSTDNNDVRSSFSNYGDSTDITAPGTAIYTLDRTGAAGYETGDYTEFEGTSASSPIAAAIVGLIASVDPDLSEYELRTRLFTSCEKVGGYAYNNNSSYPFTTWSTQMGYGRVNAFLAVQSASALDPPTNLQATVTGDNVHLTWDAPFGGGGSEEELIYDNNTTTGSYKYPGFTMSTQMSPTGPCQVLSLKFYTTNEGSANQFNAKVYNWAGSQPGTTLLYSSTENAVNGEWVEVDVSGEGINVTGDFVVGFGSYTEEAYIGYDEDLNNGRSWDLNETAMIWTSWEEAYLIRAVVLYPSGKIETLGGEIPETIKLISENKERNSTSNTANNILPLPNQQDRLLGLLGYSVYRDGSLLNGNPIPNTFYDDNNLPLGTYSYTVTAIYDEGASAPTEPVQATITGSNLPPPTNLTGSINDDQVKLWWTNPNGGSEEELIYDNNESTAAYKYPGFTMATHMSPSGDCQLIMLKYFTTREGADDQFSAKVYPWEGTQPASIAILSQTEQAVNEAWVEVDIEESNLFFTGDFVVGFGSFSENAFLAYDANLDNGRSWDYSATDMIWSSWTEAYLIRAIVRYGDGSTAELGGSITTNDIPELKHNKLMPQVHKKNQSVIPVMPIENQFMKLLGLQGYNLYRNGNKINSSIILNTNATDILPDYGNYDYNVTAVYDEGESVFSSTASFSYHLGVEELEEMDVRVYPNPASERLHIVSDNLINSVKIISINGVIAFATEEEHSAYSIDVSNLAVGLYIIKIQSSKGIAVSKVLIN